MLAKLYFVDDLAKRTRLAHLIAEKKLQGSAARAAIAKESVKETRGGGHAARPAGLRVVRRIVEMLRNAVSKHELDARGVRGMNEAQKGDLRMAIAQAREVLDGAQALLDT